MEYFVNYQLVAGAIALIVITGLYFVTSLYFDKKEAVYTALTPVNADTETNTDTVNDDVTPVPSIYALLPILPLILLLFFSDYVFGSVELDVVTAMFIAFFIGIICELIRTQDIQVTLNKATAFFSGMGDILKSVVMLLIAAQFFSSGLQAVGLSHYLLSSANNFGFGVLSMTLLLVLIIGILTIVSGSGSAAFLSFSNLAPEVASAMGTSALRMLVPMQIAAGTFRAVSPVAGVVIAVAGATNVDPFTIVKRTAIPMIGGTASVILTAYFF